MNNNYFVVFYAEDNGEIPKNDVIEYSKEITNIQDIKNIERIIQNECFGDDRKITLLNYKKMDYPLSILCNDILL